MLELSIFAADHASHAEQIVALVVCATTRGAAAAATVLTGRAGCTGCAGRKGEVDVRERQLIGGRIDLEEGQTIGYADLQRSVIAAAAAGHAHACCGDLSEGC